MSRRGKRLQAVKQIPLLLWFSTAGINQHGGGAVFFRQLIRERRLGRQLHNHSGEFDTPPSNGVWPEPERGSRPHS